MSALTWRERFLAENNGIMTAAAAAFAAALAEGIDGLPGFSQTACLLASAEIFPEVTETQIRFTNDWVPSEFALKLSRITRSLEGR